MKYYVGYWIHDRPEDPSVLLYEVDEELNVLRSLEWFRVRKPVLAIAHAKLGSLLDYPFDMSDREWTSREVITFETTAEDFESMWTACGGSAVAAAASQHP